MRNLEDYKLFGGLRVNELSKFNLRRNIKRYVLCFHVPIYRRDYAFSIQTKQLEALDIYCRRILYNNVHVYIY